MTLRFGMLGMWHAHAPGLVRQIGLHPDEFRLVAGWDSDSAVSAARRDEWSDSAPFLRVLPTPQAVLDSEIDAVIVEGRVSQNLSLADQATERGLPVLLEKPAGTCLAEHRRLVETARQSKLHVQMLYLFRYMSAVQEMLRLAQAGAFGSIYLFRARLPKPLAEREHFVEELKEYSGGIFFEMAGHVIDMMVAMLGSPKQTTSFLGNHNPHAADGYRDNSLAVFEFPNAWGVIDITNLESATDSRRIEVLGTEGACIIPHLGTGHLANNPVQSLDLFDKRTGQWQRRELPAATLQIKDLQEFSAVLRGDKPPDFSLDHDLAVQQALLSASGMG